MKQEKVYICTLHLLKCPSFIQANIAKPCSAQKCSKQISEKICLSYILHSLFSACTLEKSNSMTKQKKDFT